MGETRALGRVIAEGRAAHDPPLSQAELASRLFVRQQAVSMWETGHRTPSAEMLIRIAQALGVEVGKFFPSPNGKA